MKLSTGLFGESVLIHAPFGRDGVLIQEVLLQAGIQSKICCSTQEIQSSILEGAAAAVVADEALGAQVVESLAESLREQPSWSDFPLLILTSGGVETEGSRLRLRLLEPLGNVTLLERPLRTATLVSSVRTALRARQHQYQIRDHIAQRALNEQAVRESEARFRLTQRAGHIGSFEWIIQEKRMIWSPELESLYGLPEGAFEGTFDSWSKRVVAEDAEQVVAGIEKCIAWQQPEYIYEFRAVLADGTRRWLRGQAQFSYSEAGVPIRMLGVNIDIDDQKQAEAHLRRQWHTFDTALSHTPDWIYILDLAGRFTYVNRALLSLLQKPLPQAIGKSFYELEYPHDLASKLQCQIQQVIKTREPLKDQAPFTAPTGETRQYEYILVPVFGTDAGVEAVTGSTRDITDRMRAEEELRASEQRFRSILEANPFGLVVGDLEGRLQYCNPATLQMIGYTDEEVASGLVRWDRLTPPEFAVADAEALSQLAAIGSCKPYEKVFIAKDGRHIPILVGASMLSMPGGEQAVAAFVTDLSVLKEAEQARKEVLDALQSANESLRRANNELEEFAYVASHDIQEPLRMVNSYTQLLLRRHVDPGNLQAQEYGQRIQNGVKRLERLIRDLLSYSQTIQSEKAPVGAADLNVSFHEALSMLHGRIEESRASVTHDILPTVHGEEGQLAHVFQNLLANALKYRRPDEAPRVHVSAERQGKDWVVSVRDNGIGFEQQYAEKVFGLFKRLHRDEYPGTGLGLAICKRIVERFGGAMWAASEIGRGSTFFFSLLEEQP